MDFGQNDFDLLTQMKEVIGQADWDRLMDKRVDVIYRNTVSAERGGSEEVKDEEAKAREIYEAFRDELKEKYKL